MPDLNLTPIHNWFKREYPISRINPQWISLHAQHIHRDNPQFTTQDLIYGMQDLFLSSDLSCSCLSEPPALPGCHTDGSAQAITTTSSPAFGPERTKHVLVQVESIMEVGSSAFQLTHVMNQRREALSGATRVRGMAEVGRGGVGVDGQEQGTEQEAEMDDQEIPPYPRGMLMLELLLSNVHISRGVLRLTPENTVVKGHGIDALEATHAMQFVNSLRARLGQPPLEPKTEVDAPQQNRSEQQSRQTSRPHPTHVQALPPPHRQPSDGRPPPPIDHIHDIDAMSDYSDFPMEDFPEFIDPPPPSSAYNPATRASRLPSRVNHIAQENNKVEDDMSFAEPDDDEIQAMLEAEEHTSNQMNVARLPPSYRTVAKHANETQYQSGWAAGPSRSMSGANSETMASRWQLDGEILQGEQGRRDIDSSPNDLNTSRFFKKNGRKGKAMVHDSEEEEWEETHQQLSRPVSRPKQMEGIPAATRLDGPIEFIDDDDGDAEMQVIDDDSDKENRPIRPKRNRKNIDVRSSASTKSQPPEGAEIIEISE